MRFSVLLAGKRNKDTPTRQSGDDRRVQSSQFVAEELREGAVGWRGWRNVGNAITPPPKASEPQHLLGTNESMIPHFGGKLPTKGIFLQNCLQ